MSKHYKKWLLLANAFLLFGCNESDVRNEAANNDYVDEIDEAVYEDESNMEYDFSTVYTASNGALFRAKGGEGGIVLIDPPVVDRDSLTLNLINDFRNLVWYFTGEENDIRLENGVLKDGVMEFVASIYYYSHKWDIPSWNPTHQQSMHNLEHVTYFLDRAEEIYWGLANN